MTSRCWNRHSKNAGIKADIQNAQGDKTKFAHHRRLNDPGRRRRSLITDGLDSPSAAAAEKKAKAAGIKTIDYDRLTLGGSSDYYVSFDNVAVGKLQGQGLVTCLDDRQDEPHDHRAQRLADDNNATLFAQGYNSVLNPLYEAGIQEGRRPVGAEVGQAPRPVHHLPAGMLTAAGGKIDGVLAANDSLGQRGITILKQNGMTDPGDRPGRERAGPAEHPGRQPVHDRVQGRQEGGRRRLQARDRADQGRRARTTVGVTAKVHDPTGNRDVPSVLLTPRVDHQGQHQDGHRDRRRSTVADVCTGSRDRMQGGSVLNSSHRTVQHLIRRAALAHADKPARRSLAQWTVMRARHL